MSALEQELAALRAEVADLGARRDIERAAINYIRGLDRLLPDVQRLAFHDDAEVDFGIFVGSASDFIDFAQGFLAACDFSQHLLGQMDIQLSGDKGKGEIYFLAHHRITENGDRKDLFIAGRYQDEYENRQGQGWKITRRKEVVDWVRTDPAADDFLLEHTALHRAARGEQG